MEVEEQNASRLWPPGSATEGTSHRFIAVVTAHGAHARHPIILCAMEEPSQTGIQNIRCDDQLQSTPVHVHEDYRTVSC